MASMRCALPRNCAPSCAASSAPRSLSTASNRRTRLMPMSGFGYPSDAKARALGLCAVALLALVAVAASIKAVPGPAGYLGAVLALLMLAIAIIDARWFIIPDQLSAAGFAIGLINAAVIAPQEMWQAAGIAFARGAVLALLFYGLRTLYPRLRGRQGIG